MYKVNNIEFSSKAKITTYVRELIKKYKRGMYLNNEDFVFMMDLFKNHNNYEQKVKGGVKNIQVRFNGVNANEFYLIKQDGSSIDISWHKCLVGNSSLHKAKTAARNEITPYIIQFKKEIFEHKDYVVCPITGDFLQEYNCHVDHIVKFDIIFNDFFHNINLDKLKYIDGNWMDNKFEDRDLADKWIEYHNSKAELRIVSKVANLSILEKGIPNPKKHRTGGIKNNKNSIK